MGFATCGSQSSYMGEPRWFCPTCRTDLCKKCYTPEGNSSISTRLMYTAPGHLSSPGCDERNGNTMTPLTAGSASPTDGLCIPEGDSGITTRSRPASASATDSLRISEGSWCWPSPSTLRKTGHQGITLDPLTVDAPGANNGFGSAAVSRLRRYDQSFVAPLAPLQTIGRGAPSSSPRSKVAKSVFLPGENPGANHTSA